jgi:hypothetical protein
MTYQPLLSEDLTLKTAGSEGASRPVTPAEDKFLRSAIVSSGKVISSGVKAETGNNLVPCRSPYCECDVGKCTHPGCYDARSEA